MAKKSSKAAGGAIRALMAKTPPAPKLEKKKRIKPNKIHMSLFIDGEDVTLLDEFNTPGEAIAAAREFLDKHAP